MRGDKSRIGRDERIETRKSRDRLAGAEVACACSTGGDECKQNTHYWVKLETDAQVDDQRAESAICQGIRDDNGALSKALSGMTLALLPVRY